MQLKLKARLGDESILGGFFVEESPKPFFEDVSLASVLQDVGHPAEPLGSVDHFAISAQIPAKLIFV